MDEENKWDYYLKGLRAGLQIGWAEARLHWLLHKEVPREFPEDKTSEVKGIESTR